MQTRMPHRIIGRVPSKKKTTRHIAILPFDSRSSTEGHRSTSLAVMDRFEATSLKTRIL